MMIVRRIEVGGRAMVLKSASGAGRPHLRREAELLRCVAGPGVVASVAIRDTDDRTDLVLLDAGPTDLSRPGPLDIDHRLQALESAARATERLHTAGWTHGAICGAHVVVDGEGAARLCSLGSARPTEDQHGFDEDLRQLSAMVAQVLSDGGSGWPMRERRRWSRMGHRIRRALDAEAGRAARSDAPMTAGDVARVLASERATTHRPTRAGPGHDTARTRARPPRMLIGSLALLALFGLLALAASSALFGRHRADGPDADGPPAVIRPLVDRGAGAPLIDGNLIRAGTDTFRVGDQGDRLAVGDRNCDGADTTLLLRPATGEVFEFTGWASSDTPIIGVLIGTLDGGADPTAEWGEPNGSRADADGAMCAVPVVRRADGAIVDLQSLDPPGGTP